MSEEKVRRGERSDKGRGLVHDKVGVSQAVPQVMQEL